MVLLKFRDVPYSTNSSRRPARNLGNNLECVLKNSSKNHAVFKFIAYMREFFCVDGLQVGHQWCYLESVVRITVQSHPYYRWAASKTGQSSFATSRYRRVLEDRWWGQPHVAEFYFFCPVDLLSATSQHYSGIDIIVKKHCDVWEINYLARGKAAKIVSTITKCVMSDTAERHIWL